MIFSYGNRVASKIKTAIALFFLVAVLSFFAQVFYVWDYGLGEQLSLIFSAGEREKSLLALSTFTKVALLKAFQHALLAIVVSVALEAAFYLTFVRTRHLRGAQKEKRWLYVLKNALSSCFFVGGVPIIKEALCRHFLYLGATGVGKSLAIKETMRGLKRKGASFFIIDIDDSFSDFSKNTISLSGSALRWDLENDLKDAADCHMFAKALISSEREDFWINSARVLLVAILSLTKDCGQVFKLACRTSAGELIEKIKGTDAAYLVDDSKDPKTFQSILATLGTYVNCLKVFSEGEKGDSFSLRDFLDSGKGLRISCSQKQLASCSLLLAAFSEIYISHMLSSQKKYHQAGLVRNVFVLDEIASLGAIPSLSDYLARGRKYGLSALIGAQDIGQIRRLYGEGSGAILANLGTKFFFRQGDFSNARYASQNLGEVHQDEAKTSLSSYAQQESYNLSHAKDKDFLYIATELTSLADRQVVIKQLNLQPVVSYIVIK